ncbi:MAG TPA: hypothetical protein PKA88_33295, partial [Polyangiaceae bacterium]|nr:hypothetical protein [Polyangiaceae bacterium]
MRGALGTILLIASALLSANTQAATLRVEPGQSVQAALDRARDGDVVLLAPGKHRANAILRRRVKLRGPGATLSAGGKGTVVRVEGAFATVEDLALRDGGKDLGAPDACAYVAKSATGAVLRRLDIRCPGFGVWVHATLGAQVLDS